MLKPFLRRWQTKGRYIPKNPWCKDMHKALDMFHQGGPGIWICSQFVAWTLAFPGGLNMNPANIAEGCDLPKFEVVDLQPFPGDLLYQDYWSKESSAWTMKCDVAGCWVGVPMAPEWAGGTTSTTSTTTTPTTTTSTTTT